MAKHYYKGTIYKLEAISQEIVHDRIIKENAVLYQSVIEPFTDLVTGQVFNDRENAESLIYDHHYSMASYLDTDSLIPISKEEAAHIFLKEVFGDEFSHTVSEQEVSMVLKRTMH